ncbi:hypothetical protein ALQ04_01684 [Pseudomonas cichorii]|uniref:Uncharacterized protein n=1 Tax=Pseudomonas cichorii TaxID=36746 RepID=A0A3M4LSX9_PSECI|nr:hypothetical protein [Pseudomonas cichorii]RMQ44566.1 hypothetical protein ALQ04_01684 [Pseudomonas cichorii]
MGRDRSARGKLERKENTREERKPVVLADLIVFSFKHLEESQPRNDPQTLEVWQQEKLFPVLLTRLKELSRLTRDEAVKQQLIKVYGDFPPRSDFTPPDHIDKNVAWGVIKGIGGQKGTVAGYMIENTFYVVFLDKDHRFWITEKKNT